MRAHIEGQITVGNLRTIRDIRFYEGASICGPTDPPPPDAGELVKLPRLCWEYGKRIARTLENDGFSAGRPDHVYFILTTALPPGEFTRADWKSDDQITYVNAGVDAASTSALTDDEADTFLIELVFAGLAILAREEKDAQLLAPARERVLAARSELRILAKRKETKSYRAEVYYQIRPLGGRSVGILRYEDLKSGRTGEKVFVKLDLAGDIYPLTGTITVAKGIVTIKPRASFRAQCSTTSYQTPFEVSVEELLA